MEKRLFEDKRNVVVVLLSILILLKVPQEGLMFLLWAISSALTCAIIDFLICKYFHKRNLFPKSAVITGLIVGGILDYSLNLGVLIIFCFLAIVSKHVIRSRKKHVFNPANFSLFFAGFFKLPLTWNIESNIYLIILIGVYLAYVFRKFYHIGGFLVSFVFLFFIFAKVNPVNLLSWFFLFIMLIEPKTSGYGMYLGFLFGLIAGIFSLFVFKFFPYADFLVGGLFFANLARPLLERFKMKK